MISNANSLSYTYPNSPEFKIAAVTVNIIYVPLVVMIFGLIFQTLSGAEAIMNENVDTAYDWRIVGLMIPYLGTLLIPMLAYSQHNARKRFIGLILYYCCLIVILVLGFIVIIPYVPSNVVVDIYFNGYAASLFNEITLNDGLICAVSSFSKNVVDENAPHNLYNEVETTKLSAALMYMSHRGYDGFLYLYHYFYNNGHVTIDDANPKDIENLKDIENPIAKI